MLIDRDAAGDRDKAHGSRRHVLPIGLPKHMEMGETLLGKV